MEKSKNKKKPTKNTASKTSQSSDCSIEENFSAKELQQMTLIANAIVKAEEIRAQREEGNNKAYKTVNLLKYFTVIIFGLIGILLIISLIPLFLIFINQNTFFDYCTYVYLMVMALVFGIALIKAVPRTLDFDCRNINDRNYILNLFAAATSMVTIIIAIIAIAIELKLN